jgi:hypothetical protein
MPASHVLCDSQHKKLFFVTGSTPQRPPCGIDRLERSPMATRMVASWLKLKCIIKGEYHVIGFLPHPRAVGSLYREERRKRISIRRQGGYGIYSEGGSVGGGVSGPGDQACRA